MHFLAVGGLALGALGALGGCFHGEAFAAGVEVDGFGDLPFLGSAFVDFFPDGRFFFVDPEKY